MFERYGVAMYQAQVLEHRITQTLGVARTAAKQFRTREEASRDFQTNYTATLGTLLRYLRPHIDDPGLEAELTAALETRNRLAHHFFWEHQENMDSDEGLSVMTEDAYDAQLQFQAIITKLFPVMGRFLDTIGSSPDDFVEGLSAALEEELREQHS